MVEKKGVLIIFKCFLSEIFQSLISFEFIELNLTLTGESEKRSERGGWAVLRFCRANAMQEQYN